MPSGGERRNASASSGSAVRADLLPALALTFNALVWGVSWWPFRHLQAGGLHPLWTTVAIYLFAGGVVAALRPRALVEVARTPSLWVLVLAAGSTNAAFNWAVSIGDVVRVVLLFYLMPIWAVLLARVLLKERITAAVVLRLLLALGGAAVVLWPPGLAATSEVGLPLPRSLADWLGVAGGFFFALNNVMLRRESHRSEEGRAMAMFAGGVVVAGSLAAALAAQDRIGWPPEPSLGGVLFLLALGCAFLLSNAALQYGTARLSAHATAVVMLSEVLFAAGSAVLFGDATLTLQVVIGGALIVGAAALAALSSNAPDAPPAAAPALKPHR